MNCPKIKRLCDKLIISNSVAFTDGNLVINLPENNYNNRSKYCIVIAQSIPTTTTITAPVVFTIGSGTTTFPLVNCDCTTVYACSINTRTRYSVYVFTDVASGVFKLYNKIPCSRCGDNLAALTSTTAAPVTPAEATA